MASGLDMTLDDMIAKNKKSGSGSSRGRSSRGAGSGPGPARRSTNRGANRTAPYATAKAPETTWQHDMYSGEATGFPSQPGRGSGIETGTKLYLSNLDYGVSNEDIKELFAEVGDLKRYTVHFDRSGRSKGTAEVVFSRRVDAVAAVKKYNNVQLDGKPMKVEIVGSNLSASAAPAAPARNGSYENSRGFTRRGQGSGGARGGRQRSGARGGGRGGRGSGRGKARKEEVSAEDLDADLEKYHSEVMETN